ncbi:YqzE family protein [Evansella cellulosilytica]|nr:YqzE family protein [Evansella cellulosilytica]
MKTNDYVKYVTEQFVAYVDQPVEERKAKKEEKRKAKLPPSNRLFGLIPFAISQTFRKRKLD